MPALSKKQQKFMGIVRSIQKGEQPASKFNKDAQDVAKDMKKTDVKKFASTKHKGLPMKKEMFSKINNMIKQELKEYTYGVGDVVKDVNPSCPHYGAEGKVKSVSPRSVVFIVKNKGDNFKAGQELEKTHDQMKKIGESTIQEQTVTPIDKIKDIKNLVKKDLVSYRGTGFGGNFEISIRNKKVPGYPPSFALLKKDEKKYRDIRSKQFKIKPVVKYFIKGSDLNQLKKFGHVGFLATNKKEPRRESVNEMSDKSKKIISKLGKKEKEMFSTMVDMMGFDQVMADYKRDKKAFKQALADMSENINEKKKMFPPKKMTPKQAKEYKKFIGYAKMGVEYQIDMSLFESVNEDGHTDVASAKRKAMLVVDDANKLLNKLNGMNKEDSLPSWLSDKITLSQNYLSKATDYLTNPVESINENRDFEKLYNLFTKKDYFNLKNSIKTMLRNYDVALKKGDKGAQKYTKQDVIKSVTALNKENAKRVYDELVTAIKKKDIRRLKSRLRHNQPYSMAIFNQITGKKLPKTTRDIHSFLDNEFMKESVNEARLDPKQTLQQLGGNKFIAMTGAKNLAVDKSKNELHMKIGRNSKSISHVIIRLTSGDLYDMEFLSIRGSSRKIKSKEKGVYADQLGKMFKKNTGLDVRL